MVTKLLLSLIIVLSLNTPHRILSAISTFTIPHQEKPITFLIKRKETGNLKEIKRHLPLKNNSDFLPQTYQSKPRKKTLNVIPQNPLVLKNHAHVQFLPPVFLLKSFKKIQLSEKKRQISKEPHFAPPAQSETSVVTENSEKVDKIISPFLTLEDDIFFSFADLPSLKEEEKSKKIQLSPRETIFLEKKDPFSFKSIFLEKIPDSSPSSDNLFPIFEQDQLRISDSIALPNSISRDEEISSRPATSTIPEVILFESSEPREVTLPISNLHITPSHNEVPTVVPVSIALPINDMNASSAVTAMSLNAIPSPQMTLTISNQAPILPVPAALPIASSNKSTHIPIIISLPRITRTTTDISLSKTTNNSSNTRIFVETSSSSTMNTPTMPLLSRATSATSLHPLLLDSAGQRSGTDVSTAMAGKNLKPQPTSTINSYSPPPHDQYPKKTQTLTETTYKGYLSRVKLPLISSFDSVSAPAQKAESPHPTTAKVPFCTPPLDKYPKKTQTLTETTYNGYLRQAGVTPILETAPKLALPVHYKSTRKPPKKIFHLVTRRPKVNPPSRSPQQNAFHNKYRKLTQKIMPTYHDDRYLAKTPHKKINPPNTEIELPIYCS